ncbi:MAG: AraC family transcriptional regulator [Kiritimatiellae bacterium]|nr:AraC family transcriptional regulator [Kiritimatiellia bacterium]
MQYFDDIVFVSVDETVSGTDAVVRMPKVIYSLILSVAGRVSFRNDGLRPQVIEAPALAWLCPGHTYTYRPVNHALWHRYHVSFHGTRAKRMMERGYCSLSDRGYMRVRQVVPFEDMFRDIIRDVLKRDVSHHPRAVVCLEAVLSLAADEVARRPPPMPYAEDIGRLAQTIREHPDHPHNVADEARRLHLSSSHFRRLFCQYVGRPPHDYVLACRMHRALRQLRETDRQIKDLAGESGYDDPSQFSRQFKKLVGVSPRAVRHASFDHGSLRI